MVSDVLADLASRMGRSQVVVGHLPKVWGDDVQVRAVTQNLVANALKYAGHVADPTIRIEGEVRGDRTRISVATTDPAYRRTSARRSSSCSCAERKRHTPGSTASGSAWPPAAASCRHTAARSASYDSDGGGAEFWFELPIPETHAT